VIVMVRRRPVVAWVCVALAALSATAWIGPTDALALGAVGAVLWVGVAQLLSWLMDRAARDTAQLADAQREASEWLASQEGARERRTQVQRALAVAGPVLAHTIAVSGHLDPRERQLARVAEATLRDELRGAALLDATCAPRSRGARSRRDGVGARRGRARRARPDGQAAVRAELAAVLDSARSERVYVRARRRTPRSP
jgi:hypothetical protein